MLAMALEFEHSRAQAVGRTGTSKTAKVERNRMPSFARVQNVSATNNCDATPDAKGDAAANGSTWLAPRRTLPWGPLATWNPSRTIEVSSLSRLLRTVEAPFCFGGEV